MIKTAAIVLVFHFLFSVSAYGEPVRLLVAGINRVSLLEPEGVTVPLSYSSASLIAIEGDARFFRGIQLELSSPAAFLAHRDSLSMVLYGELDMTPGLGIADLQTRRLGDAILPARIRAVYQIPLRADHGLRTSPYATVLTPVVDMSSFPLLFRIMPVNSKGVSDDLRNMVFNLTVRPILSNEGALRIGFVYPENLPGRPFTVHINDALVENPREERILAEGQHHLLILSDDYRNFSSTFVVERGRILDLTVELQDTIPLLVFEHPDDARVYLNNAFVPNSRQPHPVDPGVHEVRFRLSDYTITRMVTVHRGRTYRVSLSVDINISETD
ncbi:MAG: hypothetical protein FWC65_02075 [Treponema sp.]|nr:hypothetical protein [Treponema sp.]